MPLLADQSERLAAGRRQRRIDVVPDVFASYEYDLVFNDFLSAWWPARQTRR
ncbi:hypothetical protein OHA25_13660 [Nonomuraea sp. NBC_00507]|uniref:hypothetical protein n=1 Tax=Nonomuraea sp. NBC_00507 TaxID=2976002 RepID=UPI002E193092